MIKLLLLTFSAISLVIGSTVKVTPCSSTTGEVKVDICETTPCQFKRGTTGVVDINFEAPADSKTLTADLTIHLGGVDVPHPSFERDACNDHGVTCPITKGTKYTYTYRMTVMPEYPKIKSTLKFWAKDDSGNSAFCFEMPVELV